MKTARISILTNGTLVSEERLNALKEFSDIQFQVSLDGPDQERHDSIRGAGNFNKALRGIKLLKAFDYKVHVLSVLSTRTLPWMEDFFKLARSEDFGSMNFIRFIPEGQGRKLADANADQPLVGVQLKEAYERILHLTLRYQVKSKTQGPLFDLIIPGLGRSGKFWESIIVDYQGYVIASSRAKLRLGHAVHDGIEEIFLNHPIFEGLRKGRVEGCGQCSLYAVCGGDRNAAFAETGNFLGKDPGCWKDNIEQPQRRTV
ncbi:MAG: radical SAM protein [Proteobacteria bacterium]|nr:MAG: radical SAM protein [Pseudomonadota bacterium]